MSAPSTGRVKRTPPPRPPQPPRRARQDVSRPLSTASPQTSQPIADTGLVPATEPCPYEVPIPLSHNLTVESPPATPTCRENSRKEEASTVGLGHESNRMSPTEAKAHNQESYHNCNEHAEPGICTENPQSMIGGSAEGSGTDAGQKPYYDPFTATEPCEYEVPVTRSAASNRGPMVGSADNSKLWPPVGLDGYVLVTASQRLGDQRLGTDSCDYEVPLFMASSVENGIAQSRIRASEESATLGLEQSALKTRRSEPELDQSVCQQKLQGSQGTKLKFRGHKKVGVQHSVPGGPSESLQLFTEGEKKPKPKKPVRRSKSSDDPQMLPLTLVINTRQDHTISKQATSVQNHPNKVLSRHTVPVSPSKLTPSKPARPPPPVLKPKRPAADSILQHDYVDIDAPTAASGCMSVIQQKRGGIQESHDELESSDHVYEPVNIEGTRSQ